MLGKSSSKYKMWADHAAVLKSMPYGCQVVNTGSTPSFKAFDYQYWKLKGFNLGFQPQPLYYDFETLKKYGNHIAKGAKIYIGIEEFKFFVDAYEDVSTDDKYYLWLDEKQIRTYDKRKDFLMNHVPVIMHPRFVLHDAKNGLKRFFGKSEQTSNCLQTEKADAEWAQRWVDGWNREFGWENGQVIRKAQMKAVSINEKRLSDMVDYCIAHGWEPILVVPPFSPNLTILLSEYVLSEGLWQPLERISQKKAIPFLNFYYDERFADYRLYENALTFNDEGRKLFNRAVQEKTGVLEVVSMEGEKTYTLRNGVEIPWISYGTGVIWKYTRNIPLFLKANIIGCLRAVKHLRRNRELYGNIHIKQILNAAYDAGFRMFDTGRIYAHSEDRIGDTVSGKPGVFVTTKCSWMDITRKCSPNDVVGNLDASLKNIKRDKADLYLLHWPEGEWLDTYAQIIEEYKKGRCRAFGACNMKIEHLKQIEEACLELPMVVQTEMHPLNVKKDLREYCQNHGIQIEAHTPTSRNNKELQNSDTMKRLTEKYHKSSVQITIRWHYQNHVIPVVSTFSKEHMKDNLDIFDFELTNEEMKEIDALDQGKVLLDSQGIDDPNYIYNY